MTNVNLPSVIADRSNYLVEITSSLNVPRDIIASDDEISEAWNRLPRVISKIPENLRTKWIVKMCIAVSSWLFDSWINYIWNESVIELRNKIKRFWLQIVWEITEKKDFDENKLNDLQDSELLTLCLKLNLITEEWFFYLDQCRDIRNNFSAAHPTIWELDDNELINFSSRCVKYALSVDENPIWVNIWQFIQSIKSWKFNEEQLKTWCEKLKQTHEAQRELLFWTMYWIYCDEESTEETRVNSLNIFLELKELITPKIKSNLIISHQNYVIKWNTKWTTASQHFFEKLAMFDLLWEKEQHAIISKACKTLFDVHLSMNNFYNEPPFAERLLEITSSTSVPDTVKNEYVEVVLACWIWNSYWVSNNAFPYYKKMVANFSPKEIQIMFDLINDKTSYIWQRLDTSRRHYLKILISSIDVSSIPTSVKSLYSKWVN